MTTTKRDTMEQDLATARRQLEILYEISSAMRTSLKLEEVLYIILTGVTSHAGLGFNRAMLFLVNDAAKQIEGVMGIGPGSGEEAQRIWRALDPTRMTLDDLIAAFRTFRRGATSSLDEQIRAVRLPLQEASGVIALAALEGMPFEIDTPEARSRLHDPLLEALQLDRFVAVPLTARDRIVGVLAADNRFTGKLISREDVRLLTMCANQAGLAIENSRLYEQTLTASKTDSLTGLWNHGTFQQLLSEELSRAARYQKPVSLALMDLDDFKRYNDAAGHQAGDRMLVQTARILKEEARSIDAAARYGGEEFAMIFPETPKAHARQACERIRHRIEQEVSKEAGGLLATISIGLATFPEDAAVKEQLIYAADMALLAAKRSGKNQTKTAGS